METDGGTGKAVDVITLSAGLHFHTSGPVTAVIIEAGARGHGDNAVTGQWVAAIQPNGGMSTTVILLNTESGHSVAGHPSEAIPFSSHMPVTQRDSCRVVDVVVSVSPGLVQTDVGRAGIYS